LSCQCILGETPLHIAVVYNDINSVKLLIKHGVDVNKRVVGDLNLSEQNRTKNETKKGRKERLRRNNTSQKQFNPQGDSPESK
jgi:ankyrin repeat protein